MVRVDGKPKEETPLFCGLVLAMAFPIPSHLPRRATTSDVSSKILSKIDQATNKLLKASLATSWLAELDETIQSTKVLAWLCPKFAPVS